MEYSSLDNKSINLGNSQIQGILASKLNSEKYTIDSKKDNTNVIFQPSGSFFSPLVHDEKNDYGFFDSSNNDHDNDDDNDDDDNKMINGTFNFINDPINSFFIGSITVVGLFVLFRLLQKNK